MLRTYRFGFALLAAGLSIALVACGDDSPAGSGGAGGNSSSASTASSTSEASSGVGGKGQGGGGGDGGAGGDGSGGVDPGPGGAGGTGGFSSYELGLNDVSILFPIGDDMIRATDQTGEGALLPLDVFEQVGTIAILPGEAPGSADPEPVEETWPQLRVVGARIDPCFRDRGSDVCRTQLRFVMQPTPNGTGFSDDALHVFYDLDAATFDDLVNDLAHLASNASTSTDGPLGVHPVLAAEGLDGPFGTELRGILLRHAAAGALTRVTAMELVLPGGTWAFRGFEFDDGVATPIGMLGTDDHEQVLHNFGNTGYSATVTPTFDEDTGLSPLWDAPTVSEASAEVQQAAFDAANAIENPTKFTVEERSCVACHTAGPARAWASRELDLDASPDRFESTFDLSLNLDQSSLEDTTQLRAFGYRGNGAIFSQRTVNESAAVAQALNEARAQR